MPLLRSGDLVEDLWLRIDDADVVPQGADVIVSVDRLAADYERLAGHSGRLGVDFPNDRDVDVLAPWLEALSLVVLRFPKFSDGRAYSQARRLRRDLGFTGELRAAGDVLPDQLAFMRGCGFDVFEIDGRFDINLWQRAATAMSLTYQHHYLPDRGFAPREVWLARRRAAAATGNAAATAGDAAATHPATAATDIPRRRVRA